MNPTHRNQNKKRRREYISNRLDVRDAEDPIHTHGITLIPQFEDIEMSQSIGTCRTLFVRYNQQDARFRANGLFLISSLLFTTYIKCHV